MGTLNDVVINKLSGGLGRRNPSQDMVSGLLFDGKDVFEVKRKITVDGKDSYTTTLHPVEPTDAADLNATADQYSKQLFDTETLYRLASLDDAEALGITAAYDAAGQSAYYQIQQYFRMNPSGDLFIMAVSKKADDSALGAYEDVVALAKDMQVEAEGAIRQMAVIYSDVTADLAFTGTASAISVAQTQAGEAYALYMPFEILLEGKGFKADAIGTMPNLKDSGAENVSVVVAMDPEKGAEANYVNTAAVGVALGAVSGAKVSENIAWVEKFNLAGEGFAKAGFVGAKKLATTGDLSTLNDMRYVFAKKHVGFPGVYFNDSHTATAGTSDFAYVENNRTINKATRLLRTALVTKIASPVLISNTGELPLVVSKDFETLCRVALEGMVSNGEVSQFDVYVDPKQNILATSELRIKAEIIPVGTARRIMVDLGFKNPFGIDKA